MERMILGQSGLSVSPIALGTADFGLDRIPEKAACEQLDMFTDLGGNFIDTAEAYNNWIPGEKSRSEKIIGRWIGKTDMRSKVVLSTKGGHPLFGYMDAPRLSAAHLADDLSRSLDNLGTSYIDLYFLHRDDPSRPVEEIIDFLEEQRAKGHILSYGFSNWKLERARQAYVYAASKGLTGFSVNQILWSPARINPQEIRDKTLVTMSKEYHDFHTKSGLAAMAYTSQAKGYLSKRYRGQTLSKGLTAQYSSEHNDRVFTAFAAYCDQQQCDPSQVIVQWFKNQPFPAVPIVSPSSLEQLESLMNYTKRALPPLDEELPSW